MRGEGTEHAGPGGLQRSYRAVAVAILVVGWLLSVGYSQRWQSTLDDAADARAANQVDDAMAPLSDGFGRYGRALGAERAFLAGSGGQVSYGQFRQFATALALEENYPGMQGIGYQQVVAGDELAAFVAQNRAEGRPEFTVKPPGRRPEHWVVRFNEPQERLGATWGFDARTNPTVRPYLEQARDSGQLTLSGKAVLGVDLALPEAEQPVAFGLFLPVYRTGAPVGTVAERRAAFLGWASSPFRAQDFIDSYFGPDSGLGVEVFDGAAGPEHLIAASPPGFRATGSTLRTAVLETGGREWVLRFAALPGTAPARTPGPAGMLIIGIASSTLLACVVWLVGAKGGQRAAASQALTRELHERARVEVELVRSEQMFRRAFDDALAGMCLTGLDGRFLRVNAAFAEMLGRDVDQLLGMHFTEITHPDDLKSSAALVSRALTVTEGSRLHKRYLRPDGAVVHGELSTAVMRAPDGTPLLFITQVLDVTERDRAQRERDTHLGMLRSVIAGSQSLVYVKDLEGRYLLANAPFERAFGVTEAELLGKDDTYLDPELAPVWRTNDLRAQQGKYLVEEWSDGPDGRTFYESVKLPLYDGDGTLYATCGISLDVTASRRAANAMADARDAALAATAAKSAFLATMSHEIRTPMNAVIGMTGLLLDTPLDDQQRQFVETVRTSGDALLAVINDVLDFSRIEAGELRLECQPFDLRACVDETLALVAQAAMGLDLVAYVDDGCPRLVEGDSTRLRQVLINLVGNAMKFTEEGDVLVTVTPVERPAGDVVALHCSVRDTGIGIPPERLDRLFKSFSQVDASTTRVYGGSGLGLAISQAIVQAMGGQITVTSEVGVGSTFSFTVELGRCADGLGPSDPGDRPATADAHLRGCRALLVDDNETNRRILRLQLESWGITCVDVAGAGDALALLQDGVAFDVAVLDMHMPDVGGCALAKRIRGLPGGGALPMVLLTSLGSRPADDDAQLFAAFHSKPVRAGVLRATLATLLAPLDPWEESGHTRSHSAARRPQLRVLLAEDNAVNQTVGRLMLTKLGHHVDVVGDGRQAVEAVQRAPYDLVLMDIHMPVMDGLEATRAIRERPAGSLARQPRILAMTASSAAEDREACTRAGMDGYLLKPVRLDQLAQAVAQVPAAAEPPEAVDAEEPPVDLGVLDRLTAQMGARPEVRRSLIEAFLEQGDAWIVDLVDAARAGDPGGVATASHALRSSSGMLGAAELARLLGEAERLARDGGGPLEPAALAASRAYDRAASAFRDALEMSGATA